MYGSSDIAFEQRQNINNLDDMVTEGKELLILCKEYILALDDKTHIIKTYPKEILLSLVDRYINKKI